MKNYYHKNGRYNLQTAEINKEEWQNKSAIVYIVHCENATEKFYKIGITTSSVRMRFAMGMPYKIEERQITRCSLYDAILLEQELHQKAVQYKYIPEIKFSGYTECFTDVVYNQ